MIPEISEVYLKRWGFAPHNKGLIDFNLPVKVKSYIKKYISDFPLVSKNLILVGTPIDTLDFTSFLIKSIFPKIQKRVSIIPFYELSQNSDLSNRISTADLVVITDLGAYLLNSMSNSIFYVNLWDSLVIQRQKFIFTITSESDLDNLNKNLAETIKGISDALILPSK